MTDRHLNVYGLGFSEITADDKKISFWLGDEEIIVADEIKTKEIVQSGKASGTAQLYAQMVILHMQRSHVGLQASEEFYNELHKALHKSSTALFEAIANEPL